MSLATLDEGPSLVAQLGVTVPDHGHSFGLDKQEPLILEGTYRKAQAGIDGAYSDLVRYQTSLGTIPTSLKNPARSPGTLTR